MASREVSVVINGEEYVSKAADDAGKGMDKFTGGIKGWFRSFVDLKAAWDLASGAARFLYDQVQRSFEAFDNYRASLQKLEGAAKLTGIPLQQLTALADEGRKAFQLSSGVANEFAAEVGKLAQKAGDTTKAKDALAAFLEIGAARGLSSAQTLQAVQQAILGIDEGTDKLFGKNPSVLYAEYADKIGTTAGKLTDQQKAQALLDATVEGGLRVQGTYAQYLETSAGKQELLNNALEEARVSFGRSLDPLRLMSIELGQKLLPVLNTLVPFIAKVVILTFTGFAKVLNNVYGLVGTLATGIGLLTNNNAMAVWGAKTAESASRFGAALNELSDAASKLGKTTETAADKQRAIDEAFRATTQQAKGYGTEVKDANEKVATSSKAAADQVTGDSARINELLNRNLGPGLKEAIKLTEGALKDLGESARTQLDPAQAEQFARHMQTLVTAAGDVRTRIEGIPEPVDRSNRTAQDMARRMGDIARSGLDLAAAFGVVSDNAATTLNTVINIGVNLARVIGSKGKDGLAELFSSIAALLVRMMGGENDRRRLIENNTEALRSLRDEVGNLNLDVTGEDFGKIQKALSGVLPLLAGGRGAKNQADIFNALRRVGLSFADVKKLADQLGVAVTTSSGAISVEGIRALLEAMGMVELGQFGQSFAEQMRALRAGFDISGADSRQQLLGLLNLGQRFAGESLSGIFGRGLTDLASTRRGLVGLFERMQAGGITAAELGGLTGNQFLELITDLIRRIDDLAALPDTSPLTTASTTAEVVTATQTVETAVKNQTEAVTDLLTEQSTLHTRVALATERTATAAEAILVEIRRAVTANTVAETVDQNLETTRRALAAQRGVQLSLG
jgi:hypothetical protein